MENRLIKNNQIKKTFKIYVYTTPSWEEHQWKRGSKQGKGIFKIGHTWSNDVNQYLEKSKTTGPFSEFSIRLIHFVPLNNGYQPLYKSKEIYKILEEKNVNCLKGEWFECTIEEIKNAIMECETKQHVNDETMSSYKLSNNQKDAINQTVEYFEKGESEAKFVWYVKASFDWVFATYKLIEKQQWKNVLIVSCNPLDEDLWFNTLKKYLGFRGWGFEGIKHKRKKNKKMPNIHFHLFEDVVYGWIERINSTKKKETMERIMNKTIWDCIVYEEYNEDLWYKIAADIYHKENFYVREEGYLGGDPWWMVRRSFFTYVEHELFLTTSYIDKDDAMMYWEKFSDR